jgi:ribosomal protein S9
VSRTTEYLNAARSVSNEQLRDPRKVERKKVGFRKSRKKEQYSKR